MKTNERLRKLILVLAILFLVTGLKAQRSLPIPGTDVVDGLRRTTPVGKVPSIPKPKKSTVLVASVAMNYPHNGPISSIAVNPSNANHLIVASESGGIFETRNAGVARRRWTHLKEFKEHEIRDVIMTPAAGGENYWAVCSNTFDKITGPLIWYRNVSGTWHQMKFSTTFSEAIPAYKLQYNLYNGKVYACGNFGLAIMHKASGFIANADTNWVSTIKQGPGAQVIFSMDVLADGTLLVGCPTGIFASKDDGTSWTLLSSEVRHNNTNARYSIKTDDSRKIVTVLKFEDTAFRVFSSIDNGVSLQRFNTLSCRFTGGAGGNRFIYPKYDFVAKKMTIYVSSGYEISYASGDGITIEAAVRAMQPSTSLSWANQITGANLGHVDTRNIAFLTQGVYPPKMVVTSDGGFHIADIKPGLAGDYTWVMENINSGLNALQLTTLTGNASSMYFGTWHNGFGSSRNRGNTFTFGAPGEGYVLRKVGVLTNYDTRNLVTSNVVIDPPRHSERIFNSSSTTPDVRWNSPRPNFVFGPIFYSGNTYIQQSDTGRREGLFDWKLTTNASASWTNILETPNRRYGFNTAWAKDIANAGRFNFYYPFLDGSELKLSVIKSPLSPSTARISNPRMTELAGGIGIRYFGNASEYGIFTAHPLNDSFLLACEASTGKLKRSTNAGNDWTDVTQFNDFFSSPDAPKLTSSQGYKSISVISFCPFNSSLVLIGTISQGLFLSRNSGVTWEKLNNPGIFMCTEFHWISSTKAFVGTYGRGIFSITL